MVLVAAILTHLLCEEVEVRMYLILWRLHLPRCRVVHGVGYHMSVPLCVSSAMLNH